MTRGLTTNYFTQGDLSVKGPKLVIVETTSDFGGKTHVVDVELYNTEITAGPISEQQKFDMNTYEAHAAHEAREQGKKP